VLNECNVSCRT